MTIIRTVEIGEILPKLPEIECFDPAKGVTHEDDLFLCALGFEERCLFLPSKLIDSGYHARYGVYLKYGTNQKDNDFNKEKLCKYLNTISKVVHNVFVEDSQKCTKWLRNLLASLTEKASDGIPKVTFDISVVANRAIIRCMKVLLESDIKLKVIYSEAKTYYPTKKQWEDNDTQFLSYEKVGVESGVGDVIISVVYPGYHIDPFPDSILIFPNFNADRSRAVISNIDQYLLRNPREKIIWLLGIPHLPEDKWRLDFMRKVNDISDKSPFYEVSTFYYKDSLRLLDKIYNEKWECYNITLAPMGSKLQAIGSSLFCYLHPEVRVMLSAPKQYNASSYSDGCKATWMIDFGPTREIRKLLDSVGTISINGNRNSRKIIMHQ